jgi:hypothetical protein
LSHYKSNLRDIRFNLFEVLRRQDLLGTPPYPDLDEETVRSILDEVNRLATGPLADSFAGTDRNPPVFDPATGTVRMPDAFKRSYRAWTDAQSRRHAGGAQRGRRDCRRAQNGAARIDYL